MSNPAHKYAAFDPNHPGGSDGGSDASIVMRTGANKAALKDLERAVFAGKKAIWPLFFATLVVGVGTSVWGLLKGEGRLVFIIVLIGWGVLFGIEGFMLNELSTVRRSHHPMIVLRLCFTFGGWFSGYLIATCVLIGIWMYKGRFEGSHKLAWALLVIQGLLCAAVIVAFVLYVQLYSRKIKQLQMQATLVTPGATQHIASAVGSMRRKVSRLSQRSHTSSSRRAKDGSTPSRRSSRGSTLVGSASVRSKASKRSSSQAPSDSGTDTDDGYSDAARGEARRRAGSGKGGGESGNDGYSSGAGSTTASDDDTLLGAHDQHGAQARAPTSTVSRSASAASASSYSSSRAHDDPTTSSDIPASLRIGSPTSSPTSSRPTSPVYRPTSAASSSTRPGTIPVLVRGRSGTTSALFDPVTSRYVSYSTLPETGPAPPPTRTSDPYLTRAPSTSPYPFQQTSTSTYAAPPPSAYSPYTAYSPPSSPAPPGRAAFPYAPASAQPRTPGIGSRPPPSSSAPPPSTSRYPPPPSYPVGRSASTAAARSAYSAAAASQGADRARLAVTNPDGLPPMPLHH
ncbi:uncharacterized protein RHOBADRAFT_21316 [Rhodotorula graminis WP1]|uniref:Proteophosphoglycan ppg4 n=1 Tax=Rhodotorula graminis (strain WP1) TaxID=578459 RepID=A0A194SDA7_RHOGW|nr:uncharacterized protein RHOBADRAFT_21316 [Rhodotorula graminis WP1]KPV78599.1 hypothetical protein RHOBADRAFT_21316 [Rhodotorula graminis WP1]